MREEEVEESTSRITSGLFEQLAKGGNMYHSGQRVVQSRRKM